MLEKKLVYLERSTRGAGGGEGVGVVEGSREEKGDQTCVFAFVMCSFSSSGPLSVTQPCAFREGSLTATD